MDRYHHTDVSDLNVKSLRDLRLEGGMLQASSVSRWYCTSSVSKILTAVLPPLAPDIYTLLTAAPATPRTPLAEWRDNNVAHTVVRVN